MRLPGILLGSVALLLGFYQAPFAHLHAGDFDHPANTGLTHWHVHQQEPSSGEIAVSSPAAHDEEVDAAWHAVRYSSPEIPLHAAVAAQVRLPELAPTSIPVSAPDLCGHDPPKSAPKLPRAPPV